MTGTYTIAGVTVNVSTEYDGFHIFARDYVSRGASDFDVAASRDDIEFERSQPGGDLCDDSYLEALAVFRKISERMPDYDAFLFHCSALSVHGFGYVFAAPSGTGKSTHAALWRKFLGERLVMVNDDKPMIRSGINVAEVYGSPFNGKHNLGSNIHVPLRSVCILRRGDTNHIEEITHAKAYPFLLRQTYRPYDKLSLAKTLSLLDRLKNSVRFYELHCNMNPDAAKVSWEAMSQ